MSVGPPPTGAIRGCVGDRNRGSMTLGHTSRRVEPRSGSGRARPSPERPNFAISEPGAVPRVVPSPDISWSHGDLAGARSANRRGVAAAPLSRFTSTRPTSSGQAATMPLCPQGRGNFLIIIFVAIKCPGWFHRRNQSVTYLRMWILHCKNYADIVLARVDKSSLKRGS